MILKGLLVIAEILTLLHQLSRWIINKNRGRGRRIPPEISSHLLCLRHTDVQEGRPAGPRSRC